MYVCLCKGVTDRHVSDAIRAGASSVEDVAAVTQACTCCGSCQFAIERLLEQAATVRSATLNPASQPTSAPLLVPFPG